MKYEYVRWRSHECPLCSKVRWEGIRRRMLAENLVKDPNRAQQVVDEVDGKFGLCKFHRTLQGYFARVRECWWKTSIRAEGPYKVVVEAWSKRGTLFYIVITLWAWWIGDEGEGEEGIYVSFGEDATVSYILPVRDFLLYAPRKWGQALYNAVLILPNQQKQECEKQCERVDS